MMMMMEKKGEVIRIYVSPAVQVSLLFAFNLAQRYRTPAVAYTSGRSLRWGKWPRQFESFFP